MVNTEGLGVDLEQFAGLNFEEIKSLEVTDELIKLEEKAFRGVGEDIFTLTVLGTVEWVWGVREEGRLVGAVEIMRQRDPSKAFLHGVIVDPERHSNGLGLKLIQYAETKALQAEGMGMTVMECTVAPTNGASLSIFLNKGGYIASAFKPDYYGPGEHRLWVVRDLTQPANAFSYGGALLAQSKGENVTFIEDNNYPAIAEVMQSGMVGIGVVKASESGNGQNLLCFAQAK